MAIVMAGNAEFRSKLLDNFAILCGDDAKDWIVNFIVSYGLIEMVAAGVCRYGDTTSNQAEQMNWSLEEVRSMAPISMIIHATTKFLEKKTERLIKAQWLSSDHQVLPIVIQEKAAQVRKDSEEWTCTMVSGSMADGLILEYYARKPTTSDHWETITIKIPSYRDTNSIPM